MNNLPWHQKRLTKLVQLQTSGQDFIFIDERKDNISLEKADITHSLFVRIGMKKAELKNCKFRHNIFINCYFREALFIDVDFTGSSFVNCNLQKARFQACNFRYTKFDRCLINRNEIISNLPFEPNLRCQLLRELKTNATQLGQKQDADEYLLNEIDAEKQWHSEIVKSQSSYYQNNYTMVDRIKSFCTLVQLWFSNLIWGYGMKIRNLMTTGIIIIAVMALIFWLFKLKFIDIRTNTTNELNLFQSIVVSTTTFANIPLGNFSPTDGASTIFTIFEGLFGLIFLGFFVAALYRKIAR